MKYVVLVPDGVSDYPVDSLGGKTILEAAEIPMMDELARTGELGLTDTIPEGFAPGSDIGNMAIFGYDVRESYSGRAPLEAASMGLELGTGVAYRCNLVTVEDGRMKDFTAGHISTAEADQIIKSVAAHYDGDGVKFHTGVSYRHVMLGDRALLDAECTPPHDITDKEVAPYLPKGPASSRLLELMNGSVEFLKDHPVNVARRAAGKKPVTQIWLWGQGTRPNMAPFVERYGVKGAVISAVDLVNGIGRVVGMEVVKVPGVTGFIDTNYEGKAQGALDALKQNDLVYVHVEATDEAGHMGDAALKIKASEFFDQRIVAPIVKGLRAMGEFRLLLMPDHPTPVRLKTHVTEPVPYILYASDGSLTRHGTSYDENAAAATGLREPHAFRLMGRLTGVR